MSNTQSSTAAAKGALQHAGGTTPTERIQAVDVLRGFALFGVLLVNATMINSTMMAFNEHPLKNPWATTGALDFWTNLFVQVLGQGKFYTLFTILFGLGFYLFTERNTRKGYNGKRLFQRRLVYLLLFGIAHFALVWYGDILHVYALVGFMLVPFYKAKPSTLRNWAVGLLIFYIVSITGLLALQDAMAVNLLEAPALKAASVAENAAYIANADAIYAAKNYSALVGYRLSVELPIMLANLVVFFPRVLGMFLLGYYIGKIQLLERLKTDLTPLKKLLAYCLPLAILTNAAFVLIQSGVITSFGAFTESATSGFEEISHIFTALSYAALVGLAYYRWSQAWIFKGLAGVGRMALTNYLVQCTVLSLVFYGPGLGLMYQVGTGFSIALAIGLFTVQMLLSPWLLSIWTQGPAERLWRHLTYLGAKPLPTQTEA